MASDAKTGGLVPDVAVQPAPYPIEPRFTASIMGRYDSCDAAYAHSMELAFFCQDHGIPSPDKGSAIADRGQRLHAVLAEVPFVSRKYRLGEQGLRLWPLIHSAADRFGVSLKPGDRWFIKEAIQRRDDLIDYAIEKAGGIENLGRVEIIRDTQRFGIRFDFPDPSAPVIAGEEPAMVSEWVTGRPDVCALIYDKEGNPVRCVIADYKTGFAGQGTEKENAQLKTLAVQVAVAHPTLKAVTVALLARADLKEGEVTCYTYSAAKIAGEALPEIKRTVTRSLEVADVFFKTGSGDISKEDREKLNAAAKVGDACFYCKGKACCGAVRSHLRERVELILGPEKDAGYMKYLSSRVAALVDGIKDGKAAVQGETIIVDGTNTMTITDLAEYSATVRSFEKTLKLAGAVIDDTNELVRSLQDKGLEVPGHTVGKGAPTLAITGDIQTLFDGFREKGLISQEMSFDQWALRVGGVSATAVRDFLADSLKISGADVLAKCNELFKGPDGKAQSPFVVSEKRGTVKCDPKAFVAKSVQEEQAKAKDGPIQLDQAAAPKEEEQPKKGRKR